MSVIIIAAVAENGVIGKDGDLPWHLPKDLKRFKALTSGHTIIMGRKTFDSCNRRPLPNRRNIVVTRNQDFDGEGVEIAHSVEDAVSLTKPDDTVFIVGGSAIYQAALPIANAMDLTRIHARIEGHTFFPEFDQNDWQLVNSETHQPDERHAHSFTFQQFSRKNSKV